MPTCAISGCYNCYPKTKTRPDPEKHQSFQIPKSDPFRSKWLEKINKQEPYNGQVCAKHFKNEDFKFFVGEKDMRGRIRTTCKLKENAVPSLYLSGDIPVIKGMLLKRAEVKGSVLVLKDIKKENLENSSDNIEPGSDIYGEDFEQVPDESEKQKMDSKFYSSKIQSALQPDQNVKQGQSWQTGFF